MKHVSIVFLVLTSLTCIAEEEFSLETYVAASVEGLAMQTASHDATWKISEAETWGVDQDTGLITWWFADGKVATAPVQIIGTYNTDDGTFLWAWDHPSIVPELQKSAALMKEFGEKYGIDKYLQRKIDIEGETEAWEFVAVANRLAESNGGYRAESGGPLVFMTHGTISLSKDAP